MTIEITKREKESTFEEQNNTRIIMTVSNTHFPMLKLISLSKKVITNPYAGVLMSLLLILPSLYIILEDITIIRKEYFFLAIGIPLYIKSLNKIFDEILNRGNDKFK